ncbi:MAG: hypothetical protein ACXV7F_10020 [Methylomonas sp.]
MNPLLASAVSVFIRIVLGSSVFSRIEASVMRWADKKISGAEKRKGVLDELEVIGLKTAEWVLRLGIELAVGKLKKYDTTQ